jgi:hypothetical protein
LDAAQLVDTPNIQDPRRRRADLAGYLDHHVRAARDRLPTVAAGQQVVGLFEGGGGLDWRFGWHQS